MSITSTRGGLHIARCDDNPHCQWRFRSASMKSALREQLEREGAHVKTDRTKEGGLLVLCPNHKPKPLEGVHMPQRRTY